MKIIVSIPAYNEQDTIVPLINDIKEAMSNQDYEIQIVDDGSKDKTVELAKQAGAKVYQHTHNMGLAETFRTEIDKALKNNVDIFVHIDADRQYDPKEIPKLIEPIKQGYDLVLGSRFTGTIESMPLIKKWGNKAFSKVISTLVGTKITDGQTGFRAFTREVAKTVPSISNHTYTQEQIIRASKQKFRIKEVPIHFAKRHDKSRLISNPFGYALKAFINIARIYRDYKPLNFFGSSGFILFSIGFFLGLYLLNLHFLGGGISGHLPLIMFTVLLLSIGFQIILFGFLADMLKKQ